MSCTWRLDPDGLINSVSSWKLEDRNQWLTPRPLWVEVDMFQSTRKEMCHNSLHRSNQRRSSSLMVHWQLRVYLHFHHDDRLCPRPCWPLFISVSETQNYQVQRLTKAVIQDFPDNFGWSVDISNCMSILVHKNGKPGTRTDRWKGSTPDKFGPQQSHYGHNHVQGQR